jgi:hypothetical protein
VKPDFAFRRLRFEIRSGVADCERHEILQTLTVNACGTSI